MKDPKTKHIAFIRPKPWPLANVKVANEIKKQFSDCEVDIIDVQASVKQRLDILFINTILVALHYGFDIVSGYKKFKEAFWRTPYIFRAVKRLLAKQLSKSNYWFTFQIQSLFDCSLPGTPHFVYTDHTHLANLRYSDVNPRKMYPQKWIEMEKQIYSNAAITFVRSSNIEQSLVEQYQHPSERVICVYAGNNVDINNTEIREKSYSGQNILYVGIDWERKGGPDLAEAFKSILKLHPNATLTIAGAKPQLNLPNCQILGKIPPEDLRQYYQAASIFCMPTHVEPFGVAFLEAMQARLPIIATRVGAIPDFVQDEWNGFLVAPGDIQGITASINKLLSSPALCREFGTRSFAIANDRYTWDAVGKKIRNHVIETLP